MCIEEQNDCSVWSFDEESGIPFLQEIIDMAKQDQYYDSNIANVQIPKDLRNHLVFLHRHKNQKMDAFSIVSSDGKESTICWGRYLNEEAGNLLGDFMEDFLFNKNNVSRIRVCMIDPKQIVKRGDKIILDGNSRISFCRMLHRRGFRYSTYTYHSIYPECLMRVLVKYKHPVPIGYMSFSDAEIEQINSRPRRTSDFKRWEIPMLLSKRILNPLKNIYKQMALCLCGASKQYTDELRDVFFEHSMLYGLAGASFIEGTKNEDSRALTWIWGGTDPFQGHFGDSALTRNFRSEKFLEFSNPGKYLKHVHYRRKWDLNSTISISKLLSTTYPGYDRFRELNSVSYPEERDFTLSCFVYRPDEEHVFVLFFIIPFIFDIGLIRHLWQSHSITIVSQIKQELLEQVGSKEIVDFLLKCCSSKSKKTSSAPVIKPTYSDNWEQAEKIASKVWEVYCDTERRTNFKKFCLMHESGDIQDRKEYERLCKNFGVHILEADSEPKSSKRRENYVEEGMDFLIQYDENCEKKQPRKYLMCTEEEIWLRRHVVLLLILKKFQQIVEDGKGVFDYKELRHLLFPIPRYKIPGKAFFEPQDQRELNSDTIKSYISRYTGFARREITCGADPIQIALRQREKTHLQNLILQDADPEKVEEIKAKWMKYRPAWNYVFGVKNIKQEP